MTIRYIVAGTGHSGTAFASRLLNLAGGNCGHEQILNHDRAGSFHRLKNPGRYQGDASLAAFAYLADLPADTKTLHLLRHPLDVVASMVGNKFLADLTTPYGAFVAGEVPRVAATDNHLGRIIRYIVAISDIIALRARGPYRAERVEDLTDVILVADLLGFLGLPAPRPNTLALWLEELGTNINHHPRGRRPSWDDIAGHPDGYLLIEHAARYGYQ